MECAVCQSTNLVKVSLAYEQGLSAYKGRSRSHGLSLGKAGWASGAAGRRPPAPFRPVFQPASALLPSGRIGRLSSGGWRGSLSFGSWELRSRKMLTMRRNSFGYSAGPWMPMPALWSFCGALFGDTTTVVFPVLSQTLGPFLLVPTLR